MNKKSKVHINRKDNLTPVLFVALLVSISFSVILYQNVHALKAENEVIKTRQTLLQAEINGLNKCIDTNKTPCRIIFN